VYQIYNSNPSLLHDTPAFSNNCRAIASRSPSFLVHKLPCIAQQSVQRKAAPPIAARCGPPRCGWLRFSVDLPNKIVKDETERKLLQKWWDNSAALNVDLPSFGSVRPRWTRLWATFLLRSPLNTRPFPPLRLTLTSESFRQPGKSPYVLPRSTRDRGLADGFLIQASIRALPRER
jgi:hypothetical protein